MEPLNSLRPAHFHYFRYSKKCNEFCRIALPVYWRDYLSKGDPQLNAGVKGFAWMNLLFNCILLTL